MNMEAFNFDFSFKKNKENYDKLLDKIRNNENPLFVNKINRNLFFPQFSFAFIYSALFLKLIFFNHYQKYNKTIKLFLLFLFQNTIEPLTLLTSNII